MIDKKTKRGNLDEKKKIYLLIGLLVTILAVVILFEFVTSKQKKVTYATNDDDIIIVDSETKKTDDQKNNIKNNFIRKEIIIEITDKPVTDTFDWDGWFNQPDINIQDTIEYIPEVVIDPPKRFVEIMPTFPGGYDEWNKYLVKNLVYPGICIDLKISGTVLVEFIVEKDGTISNVTPIVSVYPDLDDAAINVIKNSPKWIPGKQMDKPVRVYYRIPIKFTINN